MGNALSSLPLSRRQKATVRRAILFLLSFVLSLPTVIPAQDFFETDDEMAEAVTASQNDLIGPAGTEQFGAEIAVLPNGNLIVTDPYYDITAPFLIEDAGAVFLYNGGNGALIPF